MAYQETTTQSYGSRIGNSFKGIVVGGLLFLGGTGLLWWNEGRTVKQADANEGAQKITVEMSSNTSVDTAFEGKVVHATGQAETKDVLKDDLFGISENATSLKRTVEYFQYVEHSHSETKQNLGGSETTTTTYTYDLKWTDTPVDSIGFKDPAYQGKNRVIYSGLKDVSSLATTVSFGAYVLPEYMVKAIGPEVPIVFDTTDNAKLDSLAQKFFPNAVVAQAPAQPVAEVADNKAEAPATQPVENTEEKAPAAEAVAVNGEAKPVAAVAQAKLVHFDDNGQRIYLGRDPGAPALGDIRISFKKVAPSAQVSLISQVTGNTFTQYVHPKNGYTFSAFEMGTVPAAQMFQAAEEANTTTCWVLRILGFILVFVGVSNILKPLSVLASVVPFIGKIVGAGTKIIAGIFSGAWSLLIVAIAWIFYRPVIGITLLVLMGALVYAIVNKLKKAPAPVAPAPDAPTDANAIS